MAEAAGLVIGGVGLAALFSTSVECLDYISLGRNIGKDYQLSATNMILLKVRLYAWGKSLRVTQPGQEHPVLRDCWLQERETVGMSLFGIKTTFDDAGKLEKKYGLEQSSAASPGPAVYQQIAEKMEFAIASCQKDASFGKRIVWADPRQEEVRRPHQ